MLFLLKRYLTVLQCSSHLLDADLPATTASAGGAPAGGAPTDVAAATAGLQMSELGVSHSIYRCGR